MTDKEKQEYELLKMKSINGIMSVRQALKYFELKRKAKDEQRSN